MIERKRSLFDLIEVLHVDFIVFDLKAEAMFTLGFTSRRLSPAVSASDP
jgi:hypothetical protein